MKVRWWILGTLATLAGGALLLKHLVDHNINLLDFVESGNGKNLGEFSPEIPESEFDGIDFLA